MLRVWGIESSVSYTLTSNVETLILTGTANINATGTSLADTLIGNAGNNILNGSSSADTMIGGLGNDTYYVSSVGEMIIENADEGIDTAMTSRSYTLADHVENLTLTVNASVGTGNALDNVMTGNDAGSTLAGGLGNDTYVVDYANLTVTENSSEGTDTVQASITYTLGSNVENLTLTGSSNINGTGNSLANSLSGNNGNNTLTGSTGNDSLQGGAGNDVYSFSSGDGQDTINDASGTADKVLFAGSVSQSVVAIFQDGSGNLQIGYTDSSGDLITAQNQTTATNTVERFELSTGYYMTDADINQVLSDMATYASANSISLTSLSDVKNDANLLAIVNGGWHT